ncbi:transporter substrate-binding domain-containing protein [Hansschlegelia plantiphila]|uniref:Aliphatic amidase expression-regulating protein n=1 Tax=Hansschlegelia plantiphila TaxID=374655 RepID=A0A9W6IYR7_9HYPH|nr:transporter substrate-binding domain-containing protein [Hansschlegelia plantiphila]GLK67606.1 hypothetical protein GCM10008179_12440 [Hansschlegelia plantiphila]
MTKASIPVGILYSLTGFYGGIGREMRNGALLACEEANESAAYPFRLDPIEFDPGGSLEAYQRHCRALIQERSVRHIIGCYTSASRKAILPMIEGHGCLLWQSARYEGFESSENVLYIGSAPNQNVVPLMQYVRESHSGDKIYCVGSNYVWAWEINRIVREYMEGAVGGVTAERLVPMGDASFDHIIRDIVRTRPRVLLNTLIGQSAYSFYRAWTEAAKSFPFLNEVTKLSLTLTEPEIRLVGTDAVRDYVVSSVYFQSIARAENQSFLERYRDRFGQESCPSVDAEAAYLSGLFLARAIAEAGTTDVEAVKTAVYRDRIEAPQGPVWIDADNNHAYLTPRLARVSDDGVLRTFWEAPGPVKPDPFLTWVERYESGGFRPAERSSGQRQEG